MKQLLDGMTAGVMKAYPEMPERRARRKSKNTLLGAILLLMGAIAFFTGMALMVLPFFVMKEHPGTWLLAFGGLVVTFGFFFVTLGARAMSDDVIDNEDAPRIIQAIGKSIGFARGKTLDG